MKITFNHPIEEVTSWTNIISGSLFRFAHSSRVFYKARLNGKFVGVALDGSGEAYTEDGDFLNGKFVVMSGELILS
jgi:hypothetical protein